MEAREHVLGGIALAAQPTLLDEPAPHARRWRSAQPTAEYMQDMLALLMAWIAALSGESLH